MELSLGQKIMVLRKKQNMTQKDLAKLLNINPSNFPNYESGKYSPSIDMLVKLADYFNVSLDSLVRDKNSDELLAIKDPSLIQLTKKIDQLDTKNKDMIKGLMESYIRNLQN